MAKVINETTQETDDKIIKTRTFADSRLEYGLMWGRLIKEDEDAFPTPEEMLIGLYNWLCN